MKTFVRVSLCLVAAVAFALTLSACTIKASSKSSSDSTTDFASSTSGRAWLTQDGLVKADQKVQAFAAVTFENLQQDMAQGHGEYLASLWAMLGRTDVQEAVFFTRTQETYLRLFPSEQTTPEEMLAVLTSGEGRKESLSSN